MKYDVIVIGGGPGGLMAAKTAAEDGLKVLLVERKRDITKVNRACLQTFQLDHISTSWENEEGARGEDVYLEPVSVEIFKKNCRFNFPARGFSVEYDGALLPYYNRIDLSPSGYHIYKYPTNDKIWAFYFKKEALLAGLLSSAQKAGAEIMPETIGMGAENTLDGVRVRVRGKSGEQTLETRTAIAADGVSSNIVDSLGFNKDRRVMTPWIKFLGYGFFPGHSVSSPLA